MRYFLFSFICCSFSFPFTDVYADDPSEITGREIIEKVAEIYANCESYSDEGKVKSPTVEINFFTRFKKPNQFRFEFEEMPNRWALKKSDNPVRYIVWINGEMSTTYWDIGKPKLKKNISASHGIAAATGVSHGSSHLISALLMPNSVGGRKLTDLEKIERNDDINLNGNDCFKLQGLYAGNPLHLVIEKSTFLIREITIEMQSEDGTYKTKLSFQPIMNKPISEEELRFNPPQN